MNAPKQRIKERNVRGKPGSRQIPIQTRQALRKLNSAENVRAEQEASPSSYAVERAEEAGERAAQEGSRAVSAGGRFVSNRFQQARSRKADGKGTEGGGPGNIREEDAPAYQRGKQYAKETAKKRMEMARAVPGDPGLSDEGPVSPAREAVDSEQQGNEITGRRSGKALAEGKQGFREGHSAADADQPFPDIRKREPVRNRNDAAPKERESIALRTRKRETEIRGNERKGIGRKDVVVREMSRAEEQGRIRFIKARKTEVKHTQTAKKRLKQVVRGMVKAVRKAVVALSSSLLGTVFMILIIGAIAMVLGSAFGILWAEDANETMPLSTIISRIDLKHTVGIEEKIRELSYPEDVVYSEIQVIYAGDNDGDSAVVNNWNDVLAIYAVLETTDEVNPIEVITVTDQTESQISEVYKFMNKVTYETEVLDAEENLEAPAPTADPDGNLPEAEQKQKLVITVNQSSMTWREAAWAYGFTEYQYGILEELMKPEYYEYFARLSGVDLLGGADLTQILSGLPESGKGADIIRAAVKYLGAPYVWGAKGPDRFDCSGFVHQAIADAYPELDRAFATNAAGQAKYLHDLGQAVGQSELQPGDLVFWQNLNCSGCTRWNEIHHVGLYIGDGRVIEASSGKGRVVIRDLWEKTNYPLYMFGRVL